MCAKPVCEVGGVGNFAILYNVAVLWYSFT